MQHNLAYIFSYQFLFSLFLSICVSCVWRDFYLHNNNNNACLPSTHSIVKHSSNQRRHEGASRRGGHAAAKQTTLRRVGLLARSYSSGLTEDNSKGFTENRHTVWCTTALLLWVTDSENVQKLIHIIWTIILSPEFICTNKVPKITARNKKLSYRREKARHLHMSF